MTRISFADKPVSLDPKNQEVESTATPQAVRSVNTGVDLSRTLLAPLNNMLGGALEKLLGDFIAAANLNVEEWLRASFELGPVIESSGAPFTVGRDHNETLSQLSPEYASAKLGNGDCTIQRSGCFLASLTMASNRLTGASRDLMSANQCVLDAGGFSGSNLNVGKAANALGMTVQTRGLATLQSIAAAQEALQSGERLVVAGVDYKPGKSSAVSLADHFLLITGPKDRTADGNILTAVDPAGGREITFHRQPDGSFIAGKYRITELSILAASETTPKLPARRIAG